MKSLGRIEGNRTLFWCWRCGTIKANLTNEPEVPTLVDKCRTFRKYLDQYSAHSADDLAATWKMAGISESINLPGDRS
jgi:hypothetical protein